MIIDIPSGVARGGALGLDPLPTTLYVRYTGNSIQIHAPPAFASTVVCYIDIRVEDIVDEFARRHPRILKLVDILS